MENIIKSLFTALPEYLTTFFKLIGSPKQVLLGKVSEDEEHTRAKLKDALAFMLISYVLIVVMRTIKSSPDDFYRELGKVAVTTLVQVSLLSYAVFLSWKIFGSRIKYTSYLTLYSYHVGVMLVIFGLMGIISDGYLKVMDNKLFTQLAPFLLVEVNLNKNGLLTVPFR